VSEAPSRRVRVAVVDDSDDVRFLLKVMLQRDQRFEVVAEAADGIEAVERIGEAQPDLVVLDRQMPRMGGIEAMPLIRERAPNAAIVLYTANPDAGAHHAAVAAGALGVLEKELAGDVLLDELANVLIGHWASTTAAIDVHVGPVDSGAALVWIDNTMRILHAVRQHPEVIDGTVDDDTFDAFDRFLTVWRDIAMVDTTFRWAARAEPADVNRLVESWALIDRIADDRLRALGCDWSPPDGQPFFHALTAGVLAALDAHAETRRLAEQLRPSWEGPAA
jgi:CheY-like chemotaxis protein